MNLEPRSGDPGIWAQAICGRCFAAPVNCFDATQGSQSLALGLTMAAASQLRQLLHNTRSTKALTFTRIRPSFTAAPTEKFSAANLDCLFGSQKLTLPKRSRLAGVIARSQLKERSNDG